MLSREERAYLTEKEQQELREDRQALVEAMQEAYSRSQEARRSVGARRSPARSRGRPPKQGPAEWMGWGAFFGEE
jgi:hypothetical protein